MSIGFGQIIIILCLVLLLFNKNLPAIGKNLAESIVNFQENLTKKGDNSNKKIK